MRQLLLRQHFENSQKTELLCCGKKLLFFNFFMNSQPQTLHVIWNINCDAPEVQRVIADFLNSFYLALDGFLASIAGREEEYHTDTLWIGNIWKSYHIRLGAGHVAVGENGFLEPIFTVSPEQWRWSLQLGNGAHTPIILEKMRQFTILICRGHKEGIHYACLPKNMPGWEEVDCF